MNGKTKVTGKKLYSAPALEKGLDVIELLASEVNGLSIGNITTRLDRTVGELFRMLVVLEQRGYVEMSEGSDRYQLSLKMFNLVNKFPPIKRLNAIADSIMQQLIYDIEQSCHLVTYYEGRGHVVVQKEPPSDRVFGVRLGTEVPLFNTCSGHVLLAFSDEGAYEMMLRKIPEHHLKPDNKGLSSVLKKVRQQGYETIPSPQVHGVRDIGFPVFDNTGKVVASLAVPFLEYLDDSHLVKFDEAKEKIKEAAIQISVKLGYDYD